MKYSCSNDVYEKKKQISGNMAILIFPNLSMYCSCSFYTLSITSLSSFYNLMILSLRRLYNPQYLIYQYSLGCCSAEKLRMSLHTRNILSDIKWQKLPLPLYKITFYYIKCVRSGIKLSPLGELWEILYKTENSYPVFLCHIVLDKLCWEFLDISSHQ